MKALTDLQEKGGRAYALAAYGIRWITLIIAAYMLLLFYVVGVRGTALTQELLAPLTIGVLAISALAGAQVAPNVAERWGGKKNG